MPKHLEATPDLDSELLDLDFEVDEAIPHLEYEDYLAMGIDPVKPTAAKPGSEEKVLILSARYAAGIPLWHDRDCYDHGPHELELMGSQTQLKQQVQIQIDLDD